MTALFFHSNDLAHLFEACYTRRVLSKFSDITGGKEVLMPFKKTKHLVFSRYLSLLCLLLVLLVASVFIAVSLGAVTIDIGDTYGVIFSKLGLPMASHNIAKPLEAIIWNMRVPRVLLGLIVGAGLSMSGSVMQSTVNNPIAEPYILGISAGATFGATLAIILGLKAVVGLGAFVGAILATILVLIIASMQGESDHIWPDFIWNGCQRPLYCLCQFYNLYWSDSRQCHDH